MENFVFKNGFICGGFNFHIIVGNRNINIYVIILMKLWALCRKFQ